MIKLKSKYLIFSAVFLLIVILLLNLSFLRNTAKRYLPDNFKNIIKVTIFGEEYLREINLNKISNYNQKILPETQFIKILFSKRKIESINTGVENYFYAINKKKGQVKKKFFIDIFEDEIYILDSTGLLLKINNLSDLSEKKVENNIDKLKPLDVKDFHILDNEIYISYSFKEAEDCDVLKIARAEINKLPLKFKTFFETKECNNNVVAGKMTAYNHKGKKGLLVTTGSDGRSKKKYAQLDDSIYGKILFFDLITKEFQIFSKGHRNPQGLYVFNDLIFSTEHGPKGGDEINLIEFGKNYGWPISSYGEPYSFKYNDNSGYKFLKNHRKQNFQEPIYSFVPSIGISQIIKIPENFSIFWNENFLVSSLNGRSLFRIKFDSDYKKIIYKEKIIIGERIRDVIFFKKKKLILMALEDTGSIGIIQIKNDE